MKKTIYYQAQYSKDGETWKLKGGESMTKELYLTIFNKFGNLIKTDSGTIETVYKWIARGYVVSYTDDSKTAAAILEAYENEMQNTYKGKTMRA